MTRLTAQLKEQFAESSRLEAVIAKRQTAAEYLKELEKIKVLKLHKTGKENLYLNVKLYDLLSR